MKKLMIAATIAALAGASFADCNEKCTFAYRMKVMVRTTLAQGINDKATCTEGCYRNPSIRRFIGFIYGSTGSKECCDCNAWTKANMALWDFDARKAFTIDSAELLLLDRVGYQKTDKCEMAFQVNTSEVCGNGKQSGMLMFSGFGSTGIREGNRTVGAVAGYCAGVLPAICNVKDAVTCKETCQISTAWDLCTGAPVTPKYTAAYGKWTLVWDSGAAAQVGAALGATSASIDGVTTTTCVMGVAR